MSKFPALSLLLVAACSSGAPTPDAPVKQEAERPPPPSVPAAASARPKHVEEKSDLLEFTYAWPAEAAAIPKLAAQLQADLTKQRADALDMARDDKAGRTGEIEFNGHYFSKVWKTYGNGRRLLSLGGAIETFTGGAHGNSAYEALLWDRRAERPIPLGDLFTDRARALELLQPVFCRKLDEERAKRRQEGLPLTGEGFMVECPPLAEQPVVLVSGDGGSFGKLLAMIGPYTAGPYAEGSYEVELELAGELRRLIKPEFADDF